MKYTIKRLLPNYYYGNELIFLVESGKKLEKFYPPQYDWRKFDLTAFLARGYFIFCYRDGRPVGFLMASFGRSFFDPKIITLRQNLLFALPNTRAAYLLLKEFIDFGKSNANHVITAIGQNTNIKPESLKKLGFQKLEEIYRLESYSE